MAEDLEDLANELHRQRAKLATYAMGMRNDDRRNLMCCIFTIVLPMWSGWICFCYFIASKRIPHHGWIIMELVLLFLMAIGLTARFISVRKNELSGLIQFLYGGLIQYPVSWILF
jgi:hypothetical protein